MKRKNVRLKDYNYKNNGYYFVTICTALRKPLLARFRKVAENILLSLPEKINGLTIDYYEIMPTHLHMILVFENIKLSLGEIVRRCKALVTKQAKVKPFWEWNYYEHVIRNKKALYTIRKYIQENREKERINLESIYCAINRTATNRMNNKLRTKLLKGVRSIHFIGIGGIGMSGLAGVLLEKGYLISGSDKKKNTLTEHLEKRGATIYQGHLSSHLAGADLVVTSSIIPSLNPELQEAKRKKIPLISRGALLGELVNEKEGIVVAGTHGKTTTTSLICSLLHRGGKNPTMFIGGELNDIGGNSQLGKSEYVVAESDESDGSFLFLSPKISVLTSLEDDHLDYYGSEDKLLGAFIQFLKRLKPGGTLIIDKDDPGLNKVLKESSLAPSQKLITYGINSPAHLSAENIKLEQFGSSYEVNYKGRSMGNINLPLPGKHNIYNSLASIGVGITLGIKWNEIREALSLFKGIKRRFEVIGEKRGILVVDDYAHHPTEIKVTLKAVARLKRRIVAIFQPHRYTRTKMLLSKFAHSFERADILLLTSIYAAGENPLPGIDGKLLFEKVKKERRKQTYYLPTFEKIINFLRREAKEGDLILTLGAGDIDKVGKLFLEIL